MRLVPEWGGGSLWDVGVYPVSYMRTMLGMEPEEVCCQQVLGPTGVDISFSGELRFPNQVLAQFQCGFNASYYTSIEIMGEKGSLAIPAPFLPFRNVQFNYHFEHQSQLIKLKGMELYLGEADDMAECIWNGKTPRITIEDSRRNTKVMLACLESARTGQVVKVK